MFNLKEKNLNSNLTILFGYTLGFKPLGSKVMTFSNSSGNVDFSFLILASIFADKRENSNKNDF